MRTIEVNINDESFIVKTDADNTAIAKAIEFVTFGEVTIDRILVAIRTLGYKATLIKIEPEELFVV